MSVSHHPDDPSLAPPSRWQVILDAGDLRLGRRAVVALAAVVLATALWVPCVHLLFRPNARRYLSTGPVSPVAKALAARQLGLWTDPALRQEEIARMRARNAEWDFMGRTFFVLALANMALREPADKARYLDVMDHIIGETLSLEKEHGVLFFLMDYAQAQPFVERPARSLFEDGEIALMLGARRLVEEKPEYQSLLKERVEVMEERMRKGPVLCAESYPNECWMFCNTAALAAMKIADVLDGTDHSAFFREWLSTAKQKLVDRQTGMLISSFWLVGDVKDGPEGSTIWMAAHCLQLVDEEFARDQYARARKELGRSLLGFGYAREWPVSFVGEQDVDSGPVIPVLQASPGASGLALMGAAAFNDTDYFSRLCASLNFAAFPVSRRGALRYCASNQVGDAVMLYAMVLGPVWQKVKEKTNP